MSRIAFAVFVGAILAAGGALAGCPDTAAKPHTAKAKRQMENCVNFSAVPQISATIVAAEPAPAVKPMSYTDPAKAPYEGPTLGMSKPDPGVRPVPTIGYRWSLE